MTAPKECGSDAREKIRQLLNREKVKLWLPPYTMEDGQKGVYPSEFISRYSSELNLSADTVSLVLEELRVHALRKLDADKRFRESGIAIIRVKFAGHFPDRLTLSTGAVPELNLETSLRVPGRELKRQISAASDVAVDCIKLISSGSVLTDDAALETQRVGHNSHVMALCLSELEVNNLRQQEQAARIAKAREAAELISSKEEDGDAFYMQITNQSGQALNLPATERKALMMAMVLHEKGRSALRRREYGEALMFLLEADSEFKKCSADILSSVDNYALLCLDVVWCYLRLQSISSLPDAEMRLKTCEVCFNKSYGPNLERLANVKGNTGEERALLLRLHLLQGVLAYLQRQNDAARTLLWRAEQELNMLKTNDDDMTRVMEMGFTETEARLALRSCNGNVQSAVARIIQRREEKRQQREQEKKEKRDKQRAKRLGKTINGQLVDTQHYDTLVSMGFGKGAAAEALKRSNNDIALSFQLLHEQPELHNLPDPDPPHVDISEEMILQVTAMGFDVDMARAALHHFSANVSQAVEELVRMEGVVPPEWLQALQVASASSSNTSSSVSSASSESQALDQQRQEHEKELIDEIIADFPTNEEDYLDLTLDDEATLLCEYLARLSSLE